MPAMFAGMPLVANAELPLTLAPQLEEHFLHPLRAGDADAKSGAKFVRGARIEVQGDQAVTISGDAEVRAHATVIKGDRLHYDAESDRADAYGNVRIIHRGNTFTGPEAHLNVNTVEGYLLSPTYHFNITGGSGRAQRIDVLGPERLAVTRGSYTGCACTGRPDWLIRAQRVELDTGADRGVARNGTLFFYGVPVFASPYLSFPLSDARASGFLPPKVGLSSTAGLDITVPYYFNIAPNDDLTLYPRITTRRSAQLGAEYRYLMPTYSGAIHMEYMPRDVVLKKSRYALNMQHDHALGAGLDAYLDYQRVSDEMYPADLAASDILLNGAQFLFPQEAGLRYQKGPWSALMRVQRWQTLPPSEPPYGREPELKLEYRNHFADRIHVGVEGNYSRFRIRNPVAVHQLQKNEASQATEGQRVHLKPALSYELLRAPGYFLIPALQAHLAAYQLSRIGSDAPQGQPRNARVAVPTFSVDGGLIFERPIGAIWPFGHPSIQTLEPRLYYVYTPYRNQDFMPIFDTAESDFGFGEIYTPNTFSGNDRIADANRVTLGLTSRFMEPGRGAEQARLMIAQQYYFRQQRLTLKPGQARAQANHSDLLLGAAWNPNGALSAETTLQFNTDSKHSIRSNMALSWHPAPYRVFNVDYRYTRANETLGREPIKQIALSAQWPLGRRWTGIGRLNYALDTKRVVDGLAGFQYDADCWRLGAAVQHFANGVDMNNANRKGTRVLAQLELKGLSKVDNGLIERFRASVPGYMPLPAPLPPSRFSLYE
ncbi:Organic solvent tolerance protein [Candidatus Glomeribacter gigasporarum BEG34]|uniref:LPS-assembly protein LptD n=1 Tax=Candidatus Glomeribacter gigasporarum BEG34 TaxID=1070319 RepID=G2J9T1_9BURK|nr:Organic solvent tolerance protein [Candidatus Glomeribacter gigasporarum BEG34]